MYDAIAKDSGALSGKHAILAKLTWCARQQVQDNDNVEQRGRLIEDISITNLCALARGARWGPSLRISVYLHVVYDDQCPLTDSHRTRVAASPTISTLLTRIRPPSFHEAGANKLNRAKRYRRGCACSHLPHEHVPRTSASDNFFVPTTILSSLTKPTRPRAEQTDNINASHYPALIITQAADNFHFFLLPDRTNKTHLTRNNPPAYITEPTSPQLTTFFSPPIPLRSSSYSTLVKSPTSQPTTQQNGVHQHRFRPLQGRPGPSP